MYISRLSCYSLPSSCGCFSLCTLFSSEILMNVQQAAIFEFFIVCRRAEHSQTHKKLLFYYYWWTTTTKNHTQCIRIYTHNKRKFPSQNDCFFLLLMVPLLFFRSKNVWTRLGILSKIKKWIFLFLFHKPQIDCYFSNIHLFLCFDDLFLLWITFDCGVKKIKKNWNKECMGAHAMSGRISILDSFSPVRCVFIQLFSDLISQLNPISFVGFFFTFALQSWIAFFADSTNFTWIRNLLKWATTQLLNYALIFRR